MASFFDFLLPQNTGLDPQQADYARRRGWLSAAAAVADADAGQGTPLQLITRGLGGFQGGAQNAMDQFYRNQNTQTQGAADAVQGEIYKQDLDWQKKNNSFDSYKKNSGLSDPTNLSSWYSKPSPVADKLGLGSLDSAQIAQESGGNPYAVSPKGASGIAQIMPATAKDPGYGVRPLQGMTRIDPKTGLGDPASAPIEEQIRFMQDYRNAMPFDTLEGKLAAYNAGPGKIGDVMAGKAAMPAETAAYVPSILKRAGVQVADGGGIQNDAGSVAQLPQQPQQPTMPNGMTQEQYALYLAYLGERQMRSPKGGGSDLLRMGTEYNPNFKKNSQEKEFAPIALANELQKARAMAMSPDPTTAALGKQRLADLAASGKLYDKGVITNADGTAAAIDGYAPAAAGIAGARKGAEETAKLEADYKTKGQQALPKLEQQATYTKKLLQELKTHPGLSDAIGVKGASQLWGAKDKPFEGSEAAGFMSRLDQLKGGQFLQAFESLKGGGAITEVEGTKAESAIARMQTAQSEADFMAALADYENVIDMGLERVRMQALGQWKPEQDQAAMPPDIDPEVWKHMTPEERKLFQ